MVPTLRNGDRLLMVSIGSRRPVHAGDVVVAVFQALPDRYVVKRAIREVEHGWWLRSDNPFAGGDSDTYGAATVHGRAVLRWPAGSLRPRRIAVAPVD